MNNKYTFPKGFDPDNSIRALKAISYFLHHYYAEGPGVYRTVPEGHYANLLGIISLQERIVNELYDYLGALGEAGFYLPRNEKELRKLERKYEVREEEPPLYLAASH